MKRCLCTCLVTTLVLQRTVGACQLCAIDQVQQIYPPLHFSFFILALWGLVYLRYLWKSDPHRLSKGWRWLVHLSLMGWLFFLGFNAYLFFYIMLFFLLQMSKAIVLPALRKVPLSRPILTIHLGALALLIASTAFGYARFYTLDEWERYMNYTNYGSAYAGIVAERVDMDEPLSRKRIREALQSGDRERMEKAFLVLSKKNDLNDLVALQDIVLEYPPEDYSFEGKYTYLPVWLSNLGVSDITTTPALQQWIDQQQREAE